MQLTIAKQAMQAAIAITNIFINVNLVHLQNQIVQNRKLMWVTHNPAVQKIVIQNRLIKKLSFEIKNDNLTAAEKKDFEQFLLKNHKVFATSRAEMGYNQMFPHVIDTGDLKPVNLRYY